MRKLAKILLAVATVTALAMSLAMGFDESRVDYSNQDMKALYVGLDHTDKGLLVTLSGAQTGATVGSINVDGKLTAFDNDWFTNGDIVKYLGNHCWAAKAFPDLVTLKHPSLNLSDWFTTIRFTLDAPMRTVTAAYLARLGELGYVVTEEASGSGNIGIYTATQGGESIRMVIVRGHNNTAVTLAPA